jgi:ParB family chromosome partitioning protein
MSQTPKRGLGRGFESLLPTNFDKALLLSPEDRIEKVEIASIAPNPDQPRKHFDQLALEELASSIKTYGIIQPLLVSPKTDGKFIIIAGERRWRASKIAGLTHLPVVIHNRKDLEKLEISLIENVQRVDLNPLETALSIEKLHQQFNLSYLDIGKRLGKASSTVTNTARLLNLPDKAKHALVENKISEGHARQILALTPDTEKQAYLLNTIIQKGWSVRQSEQFVSGVKSGIKEVSKASTRVLNETKETKELSVIYKSLVTIKRTAHGGKLEISYKNESDLARLIKILLKK